MESQIGNAAGEVWKVLSEKGPLTGAQLAKATGLKADLVNQAVGWLAREGKLEARTEGKKQILALKG